MIAVMLVADDRIGADIDAMTQPARTIINGQRFMSIFTIDCGTPDNLLLKDETAFNYNRRTFQK
jgi:hypothetical protein